jgi:hypothetical protein
MTPMKRYRVLRRNDPYLNAQTAWAVAKLATVAEKAGIGVWADGESVEIEGRSYLLTVKPDDWGDAWDGDCYGIVHARTPTSADYPSPVDWPCVPLPGGGPDRSTYYGDWGSYYDPGTYWEPYAPPGMARGLVRPHLRAELVREGLMIRDSNEWYVSLVDPDDETLSASLGGVGLGNGDTWERAYIWDLAQELAAEIEYDREQRTERAREGLYARTAHG